MAAEMLSHGVTTSRSSRATGWTRRPSCGSSRSPTASARRDRWRSCPRFSAHTPSPRVPRPPRCGRGLSRLGHQRAAPRRCRAGHRKVCDVFCERGVFEPAESRRLFEAARAAGLALRLHADEIIRSGAAELAADYGAHCRPTTSALSLTKASTRWPAPPKRAGRWSRHCCRLTTFFLDRPRRAGAAADRTWRAGGPRYRLQPGHVARRPTPSWRWRSRFFSSSSRRPRRSPR